MASQCKRQQCTIDRRGFRQELDSWRHKLIHCVGFESILDGLFGPELVEDLKLFKDSEPTAVSDWSFDENCLFCCLRRDKVKEHLIGLSDEGLEDTPKPLLFKDQITISRLEKQAEEFLNAVLNRKDVPNFSDPHIPVVAREILQRMIRQFAAEYTSKTSFPQDSCSDSQPRSDQSLPTPPLLSGAPPSTSPAANLAGPAHNHNPVLSKLLMADQDAPLDLTIKKPPTLPSDQDGVLDLSVKRSRYSSNSLPVRSPCLSPTPSTLKGESPGLAFAKAKELQSTSTLEQFMAKLCPHHQRQIVDAIGFLQTEVKALASSNTQQDSKSTSGIEGTACSSKKCNAVPLEKLCSDLKFATDSSLKSEAQDISYSNPLSFGIKVPEKVVLLKPAVTASPALDLRSPGSGNNQASVNTTTNTVDAENNCHGDHAPLKMKIMTSNVAAGKKLSCVLNTSLSSHSDGPDSREGNLLSSSKAETHSARLSSSVKRHNQSGHSIQGRQRESLGHAKDGSAKIFSVHMTIPPETPRTARKTIRASSDRVRDSICRGMPDPDLGHCDIVFIDKPITECFKEQQRSMLPRRNARKSTRGHMYSDEIWELKTVRTLAGRGNYPGSMPELITLVTPKQILSKPEGVPPVDMPFVGACRESMNQQTSTESDMIVIPETGDMVEVAANDVMVETSQTDQCQSKGLSVPLSVERTPTESKEPDVDPEVKQAKLADTGTTTGGAESVQSLPEEEKDNEPHEDSGENAGKALQESVVEPVESIAKDTEPEPPSDQLLNSEPTVQENSSPLPVKQAEEKGIDEEGTQDEQPQHQQEMQCDNEETLNTSSQSETTGSAKELERPDTKISEPLVDVVPSEPDPDDTHYDVTSKTLDALLKELPPWRRKKGTVISLPLRLRQTESVVVGYVNGRPISASDRSLRRRSSNSTMSPSRPAVKSSHTQLSKTSLDSSGESKKSEKNLVDTQIPVKSTEATPVKEPVKEPSSAISSPTSKSRTKPTQKQKKVQGEQDTLPVLSDSPIDSITPLAQSTETKRQLRSAGQRQAGAPAPLSTGNADISTSSTQPDAMHVLLSTEQPPSLSFPSPLPVTSPLIKSNSEQPHQTFATGGSIDVDQTQPVETVSQEVEMTEVQNSSPAKQKLRSTKAVENKSEGEKLCSEVSGPLGSKSPSNIETQTQISPLRSKRVLRKDAEASDVSLLQKVNVETCESRSTSELENSLATPDKPARMPLRSESSKGEMSQQSVTQTPPEENKKLALRSQRLAAPSANAVSVTGRQGDLSSPIRIMPERTTKAQVKAPPVSLGSVVPHSSAQPTITPKPEPSKQTPNKFFRSLTGEENQHLITNLNIKYDKMHKGWVQMDKEGQPSTKYKNKADRQAAIWKSKRRAKKSKSVEHQKYSPVQMLFMKGFNLTSICRWFLETTETKSLVIVKKVNTRLPSETQLCFHSSSSSGTSQGVFPSLQAERLKKHLKKFAIASPVKCNPKSQKLIAKALEQEANATKGKERRDPPSTTQTLIKQQSSAEAGPQKGESQKSSGKSKNPASARILRKYSNIREKMQVQQTNVRLKEASKAIKSNSIKRLATNKSATESNLKPSLKAKKSPLPVNKRMKESAAKLENRKTLASKKTARLPVQERQVKAQSSNRSSRDKTKRELPKRCSQRLGSPRLSEHNPLETIKNKVDTKKQIEAEKAEADKTAVSKMNAAKTQTKDSPSTVTEIKGSDSDVETPQQSTDIKVPTSPDQVLTRSQRKIEATGPRSLAQKRTTKSTKTQNASPKPARKAEQPKLTRSGALMSPAKTRQAALSPRAVTKSATKRARELPETPAKRTRTSLPK